MRVCKNIKYTVVWGVYCMCSIVCSVVLSVGQEVGCWLKGYAG